MTAYHSQCRAASPAVSFASMRTNTGSTSNSSSCSRATSPDSFRSSSYLHEGAPAQTPRLQDAKQAAPSKSWMPAQGHLSPRSLESEGRSAPTYSRREADAQARNKRNSLGTQCLMSSRSSPLLAGSTSTPRLAAPRPETPRSNVNVTPQRRRTGSSACVTPQRQETGHAPVCAQIAEEPDSRTVRLYGQAVHTQRSPRDQHTAHQHASLTQHSAHQRSHSPRLAPDAYSGRGAYKQEVSLAARAGHCFSPRLLRDPHSASADATKFRAHYACGPNTQRVPPHRLASAGDMRKVVAPGDVFFVKDGDTAIARIGTSGGFLGHVLQVIGSPHCICRDDVEALDIQAVWPAGVSKIWAVKTLESTRDIEGLHEAYSLIYIDPDTRSIIMLGQEDKDGNVEITCGETIEVWQAPQELRSQFLMNVMFEVVADMKSAEASWSFGTAVRAVFLSAAMAGSGDKSQVMAEVKSSWAVEPICTSVVIVFWQRYLSKLARLVTLGCPDSSVATKAQGDAKAVDLILQFMPLKADRGLPGDLQSAMTCCGWRSTTKLA